MKRYALGLSGYVMYAAYFVVVSPLIVMNVVEAVWRRVRGHQ